MDLSSLAAHASFDSERKWLTLQRLLERLFGALQGGAVIDEALDILVDLLGADRGVILLLMPDGTTRAINARGKKKALDADEREEISRTLVKQTLDSGDFVAWDPLIGDGSSSIAKLGIRAALAAPLYSPASGPERVRGVLYVDFRDRKKHVQEAHVDFFLAAATLIGAVLEQHRLGIDTQEQLAGARAHTIEVDQVPSLGDLLQGHHLAELREDVRAALNSKRPLLIEGESGTGKTLLAQSIAEAEGKRPIVRATLGSSDDLNTITSELFGHERGAFSGATSKRIGLVELAAGGVIILDEVLNLPRHAQQLLLDFTQFGTYRPLGYDKPTAKRADVRIISVTNGNLQAAIKADQFRADLYYRLAASRVLLSPLRERRGDIAALAETALMRSDRSRAWTLDATARQLLGSPFLEWAGNIRQLETVVARARARAVFRDPETSTLLAAHFEPRDFDRESLPGVAPPAADIGEPLGLQWQRLQAERTKIDEHEQVVVRRALQESGNVVARAARALGIARTTFASRLEVLGMQPRRPGRAPGEE